MEEMQKRNPPIRTVLKANTSYQTYNFPDSQCLVVCGDIHGEFIQLVHKLCVQYQMRDTTCIVHQSHFSYPKKYIILIISYLYLQIIHSASGSRFCVGK